MFVILYIITIFVQNNKHYYNWARMELTGYYREYNSAQRENC